MKIKVAEDECDTGLQCIGQLISLETGSRCQSLIADPEDGTPCNISGGATSAQCVSGSCETSDSIYTYKWTAYSWKECSISCKTADSDAAGVQYRDVNCTLQNGEAVDSSNCDVDSKPIANRICNNYVCDFCSAEDICGENGKCDEDRGVCDCDSGYDGDFCDEPPALNFTGITTQVYKDVTAGEIIEERADPCGTIVAEYDTATTTRTVPQVCLFVYGYYLHVLFLRCVYHNIFCKYIP